MKHLTREQVEAIVGHDRLDDQMIAEIIETGASEANLVEAYNRTVRGAIVGKESGHPENALVSALCDLLSQLALQDPYNRS